MASLTPCYDLKRRRSMWYKRLYAEWKYCTGTAFFVTLTYDEDHVPMEFGDDDLPNFYTVSKRDVQLFFKRFRKKYIDPVGRLRYFIVSEFGTNSYRPHYHALIFTDRPCTVEFMKSAILDCWSGGYILDVQTVRGAGCIRYITSYITKGCKTPTLLLPESFCLMSRRPGIGYRYVERMKNYHRYGTPSDDSISIENTQDGRPVYVYYGPMDRRVTTWFPLRKYFVLLMNDKYFKNLRKEQGVVPSLPRYFAEKIYTWVERKIMNYGFERETYLRLRKDGSRRLSAAGGRIRSMETYFRHTSFPLDLWTRERLAARDVEQSQFKHKRLLRGCSRATGGLSLGFES